MSKRIVSAILCLALVVAMAIPAFAATTTLYSRTNAGYRITGTANVSTVLPFSHKSRLTS